MSDTSTNGGYDDGPIRPDGFVCGAAGRQGHPCQKPAGWATDHVGSGRCKLHGGSTPNHITAAKRLQAGQIMATYGLPREGKQDPRDLLSEELSRTYGHIDWLAEIIREMDPGALVLGTTSIMEGERPAGKDGIPSAVWEVVETASPSVWLTLYQKERDFGYRVAKDAAALGLLEREVQIQEAQAVILASAITRLMGRLSALPAEDWQRSWPRLLREELQALDVAEQVVEIVQDEDSEE